MNLLFVSSQEAKAAAGPNWSIPARVAAQSKIDNVCWINLNDTTMPHWVDTGVFHTLSDIGGKLSLKNLPDELGRPDMVFFEVPYFWPFLSFSAELRKEGIPYVIVPRCSFTRQALNNHSKWKKKIAHLLFFNRFFKGARAIQYLTEQERTDSEPFICPDSFIIPNGINLPEYKPKDFGHEGLQGLFIGRIDIYHKGLDLLLQAVIDNKEFLRANKVTFAIHGPRNKDYDELERMATENAVTDIFQLKGGIEGADKDRALRESDFFIMTSRFEGLPMAMLEALSYGLPCIASEGSYMDRIVAGHGAGYACGNSVEEISRAIKTLVGNRALLPGQSKAAYSLALTYDWKTQAERLHREVTDMLAGSKA